MKGVPFAASADDLPADFGKGWDLPRFKADVVFDRVKDWQSKSPDQLRQQLGELTAQEIRTVRAVLKAILT